MALTYSLKLQHEVFVYCPGTISHHPIFLSQTLLRETKVSTIYYDVCICACMCVLLSICVCMHVCVVEHLCVYACVCT